MKIDKWTFDENEWKALEEWRRNREVVVHNQMVDFLNSLRKPKKKQIKSKEDE